MSNISIKTLVLFFAVLSPLKAGGGDRINNLLAFNAQHFSDRSSQYFKEKGECSVKFPAESFVNFQSDLIKEMLQKSAEAFPIRPAPSISGQVSISDFQRIEGFLYRVASAESMEKIKEIVLQELHSKQPKVKDYRITTSEDIMKRLHNFKEIALPYHSGEQEEVFANHFSDSPTSRIYQDPRAKVSHHFLEKIKTYAKYIQEYAQCEQGDVLKSKKRELDISDIKMISNFLHQIEFVLSGGQTLEQGKKSALKNNQTDRRRTLTTNEAKKKAYEGVIKRGCKEMADTMQLSK